MSATIAKGLLGPGQLHARIDDIKRTKGAAPWSEKVVVNEQIVGTLICQPTGRRSAWRSPRPASSTVTTGRRAPDPAAADRSRRVPARGRLRGVRTVAI